MTHRPMDSFFTDLASVTPRLDHLQLVLSHLPDSILFAENSAQRYDFQFYEPDPEKVELYGTTEAALNNALEVTFASNGRRGDDAPCRFEFLERGPGLVAVVDALEHELHKTPGSAVLQKWVGDLLQVTEYHYKATRVPMPKPAPRAPSQPTAIVSRASEQVETANLDYIDDPEPIAKGPGGRPGDDRLPRLAIRYHRRDDTSKTNVCFAPSGPPPAALLLGKARIVSNDELHRWSWSRE
ncbi:hypothetical protein HD554DRAFT_1025776 [Boletus coccyginus]|nr:hypothetical protein HD554DRAFT_1025776 [Boletus coccyginus]